MNWPDIKYKVVPDDRNAYLLQNNYSLKRLPRLVNKRVYWYISVIVLFLIIIFKQGINSLWGSEWDGGFIGEMEAILVGSL